MKEQQYDSDIAFVKALLECDALQSFEAKPSYDEIVNRILLLIAQKLALARQGFYKLTDDIRLPSINELSKKMNVSVNLVAKVYRWLTENGIVQTEHRKGCRISSEIVQPRNANRHAKAATTKIYMAMIELFIVGIDPESIRTALIAFCDGRSLDEVYHCHFEKEDLDEKLMDAIHKLSKEEQKTLLQKLVANPS